MGPDSRKLLPAPFRQGDVDAAPTLPIAKKKRVGVRVACNRCRTKKTSCDGNRPSCHRCSQLGDMCIYETGDKKDARLTAMERQLAQLQDQLKQHQDLIQHLQSALTTIRRLKSTPNVEAVLSSIRSSIAPKHLSDIAAARTTLPFTQSRLEFELAVLHGNAYPALPDIDISAIDLSSTFKRRTKHVLPHVSTNAILNTYDTLITEPSGGTLIRKPRLSTTITSPQPPPWDCKNCC